MEGPAPAPEQTPAAQMPETWAALELRPASPSPGGRGGPRGAAAAKRAKTAPAAGTAQHSAQREQERMRLRNAKSQAILELRPSPQKPGSRSSSAPRQRRGSKGADRPSSDILDLERQRVRLACKREVLDFFSSCAESVERMNREQTKLMMQKLNHTQPHEGALAHVVQRCGQEREQLLQTWASAIETKGMPGALRKERMADSCLGDSGLLLGKA